MTELTFVRFQQFNANRQRHFRHDPWPAHLWALAIAGEAGELCNLLKKVVRGDFTLEAKRDEVLKEVADVITYCDLLMTCLDARTSEELIKKFNEVSTRVGYPQVTERQIGVADEA